MAAKIIKYAERNFMWTKLDTKQDDVRQQFGTMTKIKVWWEIKPKALPMLGLEKNTDAYTLFMLLLITHLAITI